MFETISKGRVDHVEVEITGRAVLHLVGMVVLHPVGMAVLPLVGMGALRPVGMVVVPLVEMAVLHLLVLVRMMEGVKEGLQ